MPETVGRVAIVDYGMGNLFSVQSACEQVGLVASITSSRSDILAADAVVLPGVGAFGDAMATLHRLDLVSALKDVAVSDTPFLGVCLGMQLLMSESAEFGHHAGLDIISGSVESLADELGLPPRAKVPQVCWNRMFRAGGRGSWDDTLLDGLPDGTYMHFVHSYYVRPAQREVVVATTEYGGFRFCSGLGRRNIFACQGHPERSGSLGLSVYSNLASAIQRARPQQP